MKAHLLLASFFLPLLSVTAAAGAPASCPQVNCDCSAISDAHWRDVCETRQAKVIEDCVENQGRPKSFCGLHGPAAFPVATSIQPDKRPVVVENDDVTITAKLIATQNWSLDDSLAVLKSRERAKQYGDALQVASLLERDIERLYQLQRQSDATYKKLGQDDERKDVVGGYAANMEDRARSLRDYSVELWRLAEVSEVERERKAYRAMAFKVARIAGTVFEYAAEVHRLAEVSVNSARAWQAAAELAQSLERWERATEGKSQHLAFYQAQAAARWHRATFELLSGGDNEAVAAALENARSVSQHASPEVANNTSHNDHEMADDTRAIKRGSR
jgi:hypothetical protein